MAIRCVLLLLLSSYAALDSWWCADHQGVPCSSSPIPPVRNANAGASSAQNTNREEHVPTDLHEQVLTVAKDLWGTQDSIVVRVSTDGITDGSDQSRIFVCEGSPYRQDIPFSDRGIFVNKLSGMPATQHSASLLCGGLASSSRRRCICVGTPRPQRSII
jgi:hypothetical protein